MKKGRILVVDDEENIRSALVGILSDEGYNVQAASDGESALRMIHSETPDLVLLDIWIPGIDGIQTLKILKNVAPDTEVVMMSGHGSIDTAVKATKFGAFDFIEKPLSIDSLLKTVSKALRNRKNRINNRESMTPEGLISRRLIGSSSSAASARRLILEASDSDRPVLITGEHGLGKKLAARAIHSMSERRNSPFIEVSCAEITSKNFDAILCGGEGDKPSRFELADGGSLFFDRIDKLDTKRAERLTELLKRGDSSDLANNENLEADVRIIASAGPDFMETGATSLLEVFGPDLIPITPLRERRKDIPEYVNHFVEEMAEQYNKRIDYVSRDAMKALTKMDWPDNLTELKETLDRAVHSCSGPVLTRDGIPTQRKDEKRKGYRKKEKTGASKTQLTLIDNRSGSGTSGIKQRTLKTSVVLCGHGLHSGIKTGLILSPLPPGSGIVFGDISTGARISASLEHVNSTDYATTLSDGAVTIKTIEHIMSALHSYSITNLLIKIGDEAPIMDGSALDFCDLIEDSGVEEQADYVDPIIIDKPIMVGDPVNGPSLTVEPCDSFSIHYFLEYPQPIGKQECQYNHATPEYYKETIAPARTFGFVKDIQALNEAGLAAGGKLSNVVLIDDERIVNTPLRFPNEPARHKILDLIGDLYLLGRPIKGKFTAVRSGHTQNIALTKKIHETLVAPKDNPETIGRQKVASR